MNPTPTQPGHAAGHTPGPWKVVATHNRLHWSDVLDANDRPVAMVHNRTDAPDFGMEIANGRLIAAAPSLLAACEGVSDAVRVGVVGCSIDQAKEIDAAVYTLRSAIALARGGGA